MSTTRILIFLGVVFSLTFFFHRYFYLKFSIFVKSGNGALIAVFVLLAISLVVALLGPRFLPREVASPLAWFGYIWMGVSFYLFLSFFVLDIFRFSYFVFSKLTPKSTEFFSLERREWLSGVTTLFGSFFAACVSGVSLFEGLRMPKVVKVHVPLKRYASIHPFRIVQLSDVHIGPTLGKSFSTSLAEQVNALSPDIVVITGDLVDGSVRELGDLVRPLFQIKAKEGIYFVTGNHEYYSGVEEWVSFLRENGVKVLRNESVSLSCIELVGVDDVTASENSSVKSNHEADCLAALGPLREVTKPVVLLAHQPRSVFEAEKYNVSLQLSGHTHGGQLYPFEHLVPLQQPYVAGLYRHSKDFWVYVSRGTGYWGPPMRLAAPSEITEIILENDDKTNERV